MAHGLNGATPLTPEAHNKGNESYGRWVSQNGPKASEELLGELGTIVELMGKKQTVGELADYVRTTGNEYVTLEGARNPKTVAVTKVGLDYLRAACQKLGVTPPLEIDPSAARRH